MNKLLFYLVTVYLFSFSTSNNLLTQKTDLVNKWDTIRGEGHTWSSTRIPPTSAVENYIVSLPKEPIGKYQLAIQLFDKKSGKTVEIGLSADIKINDYFNVQNLSF